jgi:cytochrome c peroxidase
MRWLAQLHRVLGCVFIAVLASCAACGGGGDTDDAETSAREALQSAVRWPAAAPFHYDGTLRDAAEFFRPHRGGNGRSCATCHRPEDQFALTPKTVEARWQQLQERRKTDPAADDPLFRPIDADDNANDFTTLRTKALVRVTVPLPANVRRSDDAAATTASVWRAVPTVINAALTAPFQQDGREATLEAQALSALRAHGEVTEEPSQQVLSRLASFQRHLFSSKRVKHVAQAIAAGTTPPSPDAPLSFDESRGKKTFEDFCATCHGGASQTKNSDARFLPPASRGPLAEGGQAFVNVFVGTPRPPPPGLPPPAPPVPRFFDDLPTAALPELSFRITLPNGTQANALTSDPGRGLMNGDPREFGRFDIPTLLGIAKTAPYFHDNSAADLDAVIAHYQAMFRFLEFLDIEGGLFAPPANGQGCARGSCGFKPIPDQDIASLKAYLQQLGR